MMAGSPLYPQKAHLRLRVNRRGGLLRLCAGLDPDAWALVLGAVLVIAMRMLATRYRWNLPTARMPKQ